MSCGSKYEDRKQKRKETQVQWKAWSYAQYAGETEGETERETEREDTKNSIQKIIRSLNVHVCVFNAHFYTSPYKD